MVTTPNLLIEHLDSNQNQPEVPVDAAMDGFDAAITALVTFAVTNTNALAITQAQLALAFTVQLINGGTSPTATSTVTIAAFPRGLFCVDNQTAHDALITIASQPGPVPYVKAGTAKWLRSDGVNISEQLDPTLTVATLPVAGVRGRRAFVSDATTPAFAATLTGSGAVVCPVYDDGSAWRAG